MTRSHPPLARRILAGALVGGLLLAACSDDETTTTTSAAPNTTTGTETTADGRDPGLVLGYVRPGAGLLSQLATAQEAAINLAIDDLNAAGGINGGPVQLLAVDESLDGDTVAAVNDLLDQGANMILGPIGSSGARAALEPLAARKSVACSASATATELTTLDTENVLYRTAMPNSFTLNYVADALSADVEAAELPEGTAYKVSILARNDDYGISVGNGLASTLTARGMEVQVVQYSPRQVIFTAEAAAIAATTPDAVVLVAYGEGVRQVDTLVTAGVTADKIVGLDGLFDPNFAERASNTDPTRVDGMRVIGSTGDRAFLDRLAATPNLTQLVFGAQAYDCAVIGALAAATAASSDPAEFAASISSVTDSGRSCSTVADCLEKLAAGEDIDYEGASGGIRFDEAGDPAEVRLTTVSFADGVMTEVSSSDLNLDELRQQEALASAIMISRLQQLLSVLGYYSGPIDGQWSDELTAAVGALQSDLGVPVTGVWDEATDEAARAKYGNVTGALSESVIGIQLLLTELGFYTGPIDGVYSQETIDAIRALQRELGVPETGILDAPTLQAAYARGIISGTPPSTVPPESTVPPSTIPTPTTSIPVVPPSPSDPSLLDTLNGDDRFTTLVELLTAAGFTDDASVIGPITLFAPTNDAFADVDPATLEALKNDPAALQQVLSFHLVDAGITLTFLGTLSSVPTMYGEALTITTEGSGATAVVLVNGIATIAPELRASNGIIIPVAGVLIPTQQPTS